VIAVAGRVRTTAVAAAVAGTLSGLPSTVWTLARRGDVLASTRAAGTLLVPSTAPPAVQLAAGALAHAALSAGWAAVLLETLPRRHAVPAGAAAGLAIALLDLRLARYLAPAIAALPRGPQLADHAAFGALVGLVASPVRPAVSEPSPISAGGRRSSAG